MKYFFIPFLFCLSVGFVLSGSDQDIDKAYQNAKKGVYWALSNIPEKKSKIAHQLVAEDKLYSSVKLYKKVNGVKVESTGFYNSNEVTITLYKSTDSLLSEGYINSRKIIEGEK
jgi:hypothetical protein